MCHRLPYSSFHNFLVSHASEFKRWWVDPRSSIAVIQALGRDRVFLHRSVVQEMKEVKNKIEISGMHNAHARDCGAAVRPPSLIRVVNECDLFGWLENQVYSGAIVKESDVPLQLTEFQKLVIWDALLMTDNACIILVHRSRLWHVLPSTQPL
jgi:Xaa-Pro aminopeptidase